MCRTLRAKPRTTEWTKISWSPKAVTGQIFGILSSSQTRSLFTYETNVLYKWICSLEFAVLHRVLHAVLMLQRICEHSTALSTELTSTSTPGPSALIVTCEPWCSRAGMQPRWSTHAEWVCIYLLDICWKPQGLWGVMLGVHAPRSHVCRSLGWW